MTSAMMPNLCNLHIGVNYLSADDAKGTDRNLAPNLRKLNHRGSLTPDDGEDNCVICQEALANDAGVPNEDLRAPYAKTEHLSAVTVLRHTCNHAFHLNCIASSVIFYNKTRCPTCSMEIDATDQQEIRTDRNEWMEVEVEQEEEVDPQEIFVSLAQLNLINDIEEWDAPPDASSYVVRSLGSDARVRAVTAALSHKYYATAAAVTRVRAGDEAVAASTRTELINKMISEFRPEREQEDVSEDNHPWNSADVHDLGVNAEAIAHIVTSMAIIDDLPGDDMSVEEKGEVLSTVMRHAKNQPCLVRAIGRLRGENPGINARMGALMTIMRDVRNVDPQDDVTNRRSNAMLRALDDLSHSWGAWVGGPLMDVAELEQVVEGRTSMYPDWGNFTSRWGPFIRIVQRIKDETGPGPGGLTD